MDDFQNRATRALIQRHEKKIRQNAERILLHFSEPFSHARHYRGWTDDLETRLARHRTGNGSPLVAAAMAAGITWELAWSGPGDRNTERRLKNLGGAARTCPLCKGERER